MVSLYIGVVPSFIHGVCAMRLSKATLKQNFINIPKSLAYHHQRQMCNRMADKCSYLTPKEVHRPGNKTIMLVNIT